MPQAQAINDEYKQKFLDITEKLGRTPTTKDKEFWEVSEWYRDQFDTERIQRTKEDNYERAKERAAASKPVAVVERLCTVCKDIIPPTGKRGRPATKCVDCRTKKGK